MIKQFSIAFFIIIISNSQIHGLNLILSDIQGILPEHKTRSLAAAYCGDGIVNNKGTEQCDYGPKSKGNTDPICQYCRFTCGNYILDQGQQCDDGNRVSGDGCSSSCLRQEPQKNVQLFIGMCLIALSIFFLIFTSAMNIGQIQSIPIGVNIEVENIERVLNSGANLIKVDQMIGS